VGKNKTACRVLVRILEIKRALGKPNRKLEDNIKMCWKEVGWKSMNCTGMVQGSKKWRDRVNKVINLPVP
jgi:hypothetical protein